MAKKSIISMKRKHSDFLGSIDKKSSKDSIPWVEEFIPQNIEDLAVHKKKISEVQAWFQKCFTETDQPKEPQILILTGPPGAGKTVTVTTLCSHIGAELFVWSNTHHERAAWRGDEDSVYNRKDSFTEYENQSSAFRRFLLHSVKYSLYSDSKRVILVEEIPNALIRSPTEFHDIIRKYSVNGKYPAVFIISDNVKGESLESKLFPKELQSSLKISTISYNPVAPTMLLKVMNAINSSSKVRSVYSKLNRTELEGIASDSMGDIRNAINTMQFLCMTQFKKPQLLKKGLPVQSAKAADDCVSKRDASLFLFHALGKILYCKRDASLKSESDLLPEKLRHFEKDPLVANAEDVFDKTSISADAFSLFLQENYLPFVEDVKVLSECSAWLSEADTLSAFWSGRDVLSDYTVSMAARGLMFNIIPCSSGKRWRPLHKPQFYENNSKKNRLLHSLKYTFKGIGVSMRELQIDLLPLVSKLPPKNFNTAQVILASEIGEMNVKRAFRPMTKTLEEKDCFEVDFNDCDIPADPPCEENLLLDAQTVDDEDFLIEEYDF